MKFISGMMFGFGAGVMLSSKCDDMLECMCKKWKKCIKKMKRMYNEM